MVVCPFFLRGECKFGDTCRNEHPGVKQGGLGSNGWVNRASGSSSDFTSKDNLLPYSATSIACDMSPTQYKPLWPLSTYGPAEYEPNLIGGLDESAEELRVKATTAIRAGNVNEYLQYETTRVVAADSVFANAMTNSTQAFGEAAKQSRLLALAAASASKSSTGGGSGSTFPSSSSASENTLTSDNTPPPFRFGRTTTTSSAFGNTTTPSAFWNIDGRGSMPGSTTGGVLPAFRRQHSAFWPRANPQLQTGRSVFDQYGLGQPAQLEPAAANAACHCQHSQTSPAFGNLGQNNTSPTSILCSPYCRLFVDSPFPNNLATK